MNDSPNSDMLRPQRPERPTEAEIDALARFNVDRQGPIPGPGLLAKFQLYDDFARLGERVVDVLSGEADVPTYETSGGLPLTDEACERLAEEAEAGYDLDTLTPRPRGELT